MVVDPHLDTAAKLVGVEVAGDCDHRRTVEEGRADPGCEVGGAWPESGDAQSGCAGQPPAHVGGKAGGALMRGQHEIEPAPAHRLHQRQHVAAGNAKAVADSGRFKRGDDQISIVHGAIFAARRRVERLFSHLITAFALDPRHWNAYKSAQGNGLGAMKCAILLLTRWYW